MAQSKQTSQEFIQNAFSPSVAVLCSSDAEEVCQKNNLSFVELVQPFCRFSSEASFKDPVNQLCIIRNMRIIMRDINVQPPQQALAKKMLNDVVSSCQLPVENNRSITISSGDCEVHVPALLPWFEAYRDCFFDVIYPSDHEFTKHFLSCIFVVSSSNPDPVAELNRLNQQQHQLQHQNPSKLPKWFLPNIFKGYIIIHDISEGDNSKAEAAFQSTKNNFPGSFCHLLQINSRSATVAHQLTVVGDDGPQPPDPWYQFLSRKFDVNEAPDYDNSPRTPQEDNIFPNKLSEGGTDLDITQVTEVASEVTESSTETNNIFHHPLSPNNELKSSSYITHDKMEKSIKVETISEEDAPLTGIINDTTVSWSKEQIHSRPHGLCLTVSDLDRIRIFIHEFISRGMLPYVEKQMKFLHEAVATRKGLHRSLLSATKKWFVGNKPGFQGSGSPANMVVYSQEATELQVRRLGDLAFMFQHYDLAYQAYHTAKRDFNNDQAWLYFAGALEMAALSIFMLGSNSQRQYPFHYFETAIGTYLNTCKSPQYATRATLLSTECLKSKRMYGEAAMQFIKMTSEDSDLRSALLLEQAAHCFIAMPNAMIRKYAFHMILAGHRFSKSGQRKHALRAYKQAHQVYKLKNWSLAEDHINFTIGRQSLNLKHLNQALNAFHSLLSEHSQQSASQQTAFLKEFLFVYNLTKEQNISDDTNFGHIPLPVIRSQSTKIMFGPIPTYDKENAGHISSLSFNDDEEQDQLWFKLEELIVNYIHGSPPLLFQPTLQRLSRFTNNCYKPLAVLKEPITVEIVMKNPFQIPLLLSNIYLLWRFSMDSSPAGDAPQDKLIFTNDDDCPDKVNKVNEIISTMTIPELILECCHTEKVHLSMIPYHVGELTILGVAYELGIYLPFPQTDGISDSKSSRSSNAVISKGKQFIEICGPRLNNTKAEKVGKVYGPDYRLQSIIIPPMPYLQVNFINFPANRPMLCGEIQQINIELTNIGDDAITNLCLACPIPEIFSFGQIGLLNSMTSHLFATCASTDDIYCDFVGKPTEVSVEVPSISRVCSVPLPHGWKSIPPGKTCCLPMWIRGPDKAGLHDLQFLFYYEPQNKMNLQTKYRVLRYTTSLTVYNSLSIKAFAVHSNTQLTSDNTSSLAIAMEIENVSENQGSVTTEFKILQISSASKNWILHPIKNAAQQGIKVNTRETAHLCLRAIKTQTQPSNQRESSVLFSNIPFENREIDSSAPPCSDFCLRSCLKLPPLITEESSNMPTEGSAPSSLITSSLKDIPYSQRDQTETVNEETTIDKTFHLGITLIAVWKAVTTNANRENKIIMGQHHITIDKINNSYQMEIKQGEKKTGDQLIEQPVISSDSSLSENYTQLIQTLILHPQQISHNFRNSRTCTVTVTVIIHNCSEDGLYIVVDTAKMNSSTGSVMKSSIMQPSGFLTNFVAPTASNFTWIGSTHSCLTLLSGETYRIPLNACFFTPGTYNLGNVYIGARYLSDSDDSIFQQCPSAPSLITINSECHPS